MYDVSLYSTLGRPEGGQVGRRERERERERGEEGEGRRERREERELPMYVPRPKINGKQSAKSQGTDLD